MRAHRSADRTCFDRCGNWLGAGLGVRVHDSTQLASQERATCRRAGAIALSQGKLCPLKQARPERLFTPLLR